MDLRKPARLRDNPFAAWVFALLAFGAALGLRLAFPRDLLVGVPFLTFFPAVLLTAFVSGVWPAVAVSAASGLAAWYFFLPPFDSFGLSASSVAALAFYAAVAGAIVAIVHAMNVSLDRLRAEQARSAALAEQREVLFKELQHRISNNLAIVSALLNLQRANLSDERAKLALTEAATRLALIAKIHRKLYDPSGAELRFGPFLEDLCRDIIDASGAKNIVCLVRAEETPIAPDKTVPLALIVTELISNALEHGFAGGRSGTIHIDLRPDGASRVLTVSDDGRGLPEDFSPETAASMGLRIVQSLTRQLEGRFAMEGAQGTTCRVVFPV